MRHRVGFEHLTRWRDSCLELIDQPRLAGARLGHDRNDLPLPSDRQFERTLQLLKLMLAPHELREPTPRGDIEMAARRPGRDDLVNLDRSGDALDFGGSQAAQLEITFDQTPRVLTDYDGIGGRHALHPRRQVDDVTHR